MRRLVLITIAPLLLTACPSRNSSSSANPAAPVGGFSVGRGSGQACANFSGDYQCTPTQREYQEEGKRSVHVSVRMHQGAWNQGSWNQGNWDRQNTLQVTVDGRRGEQLITDGDVHSREYQDARVQYSVDCQPNGTITIHSVAQGQRNFNLVSSMTPGQFGELQLSTQGTQDGARVDDVRRCNPRRTSRMDMPQ